QGLAREAGNLRAANTVLLGAVSRRLDIAESYWMQALEKMVPSKALEVNRNAFQLGRELQG
ncbi:MAG: indolepyruvate oxidoreductase subunit beta, partial [Deltaproteobacteria bacterium]|nr:indolepyruvate oxidoreductase subunit beta [Deltaproteobacteria bacterium]